MGTLLAVAIGFTSLTPGVAVVTVGGIGVQPIIVLLLVYVALLPTFMTKLPLQPLLWVLLTLASYAVSTAFSVWPASSIKISAMQGVYLGLGALGFAAIVGITAHHRAFVRGYVSGAVVSSIVAFGQMAYSSRYGGAISFVNNTNFSLVTAYGRGAAFTPESSMLAALLIPAILCCWFERQANGASLIASWQRSWAVLGLLVVGLISTKSTATFYLPALLLAVAAFQSRSMAEFCFGGIKLLVLTVIAALMFLPLYASRLSNNDAPASKEWRQTKIETGMRIFFANPVLGAGTGMVSNAEYFAPLMDIPPDLSWETDPPKGVDSTAVRILAETGLVGFGIAYYPLVLFLRRARRLAQSPAFRAIGSMSLGLLFSQLFISGYRDQIIFLLPSVAFAVAGGVRALLARGATRRQEAIPEFTLMPYPQFGQRSV